MFSTGSSANDMIQDFETAANRNKHVPISDEVYDFRFKLQSNESPNDLLTCYWYRLEKTQYFIILFLYIKCHIDCSENNIYNYVLLNKKKIVRKRAK